MTWNTMFAVTVCLLHGIRNFRLAAVGLSITLTSLPLGSELYAYDGPTFTKGLWLFQRSTEHVTRHWVLPNARRVKVEQPVVRCVDPTLAMIETFRPNSVGSCQSAVPVKSKGTFVFAKRCDYLGPVRTVISVESATAYRETNELLAGTSPKRDIVVARRIGDCGSTPDLGSASLGAGHPSAVGAAEAAVRSEAAAFEASSARRTGSAADDGEADERR
jgi:hypothetical protein